MTGKQKPSGRHAVMAQRVEPPDSLDLFCTPPWGTRALLEYVLPLLGAGHPDRAWDPCAGMAHMSDVLSEHFPTVYASDVFNYGPHLDGIGSFVGEGLDVIRDVGADWIVANPPFNLGVEFALRALDIARDGVALLLRTQWIESKERFDLFERHRLTAFAPFCGRLAMVKGRWDPKASTATSYAWFVWMKRKGPHDRLILIPPDARVKCTRVDDVERFSQRGVGT